MIKTYSPDSSPEEIAEFFEVMKEMASFLNNNPKAKALMEDPQAKSLSESEFMEKLIAIALESDPEAVNKSLT
jgi:predicted house-cleaning noncanonical NTP pyrophosphatase (MazG superfamily)